jgi:hypothetical protein
MRRTAITSSIVAAGLGVGGLLGTAPSIAQSGSSFGLTLVGTGLALGSCTSASVADRAYFVSSSNSLYRRAYQDGGPLRGGPGARLAEDQRRRRRD